MKQVRTAKGRVIDMAALAKTNEEVRAVGNAQMNARGDRLDASGNVIATVQSVARKQHETTSAPEKRKLSNAPSATKVKKTTKADKQPVIINEIEKTRNDGSKYIEIEYDDGSIVTKEIDE